MVARNTKCVRDGHGRSGIHSGTGLRQRVVPITARGAPGTSSRVGPALHRFASSTSARRRLGTRGDPRPRVGARGGAGGHRGTARRGLRSPGWDAVSGRILARPGPRRRGADDPAEPPHARPGSIHDPGRDGLQLPLGREAYGDASCEAERGFELRRRRSPVRGGPRIRTAMPRTKEWGPAHDHPSPRLLPGRPVGDRTRRP